jgi:excisionase family DNA binding protein
MLSRYDCAHFLTSAEVADRLAVSVRTLWRMVKDGRCPRPHRYNRKLVRWKAADVEAHIRSLGEEPKP